MLGFGPGQQFWSQHTAGQGSLPMLQAICADLSTHFLGRDQWLMREVERILSASPSGSQWHHVHHWQCRWKTWVTGWGDVAVVYGTFGEREDWSWTSQVLHLLLDDFMLHAALLHFYLCLMVLQKIVYNCNANYMYLQHRCIDSDVHSFVYGIFLYSPDLIYVLDKRSFFGSCLSVLNTTRLSVYGGGLLTLVAFKYGVMDHLPSVPYPTFTDNFLLLACRWNTFRLCFQDDSKSCSDKTQQICT